ncbi:MAG: mandelate racemase/muconate lactonizing enzyme family protein [Candidatus Bipolaricaulaceae bacterium]
MSKITVFKADIPLKAPFRIVLGVTEVAHNLFVRLETDAGAWGMGEGSPFSAIVGETQATCLAAARTLAKLLIGKDPLDVEGRLGELAAALPHNTTVRSAFDMALYDLLGKVAGLPLYQLFGGTARELSTDNTVGIDAAPAMAARAAEIARRGFPAVKVKVGTSPEEDAERVRQVREAVGPNLPIRIDANQGWDKVAAERALRLMAPMEVQYCEQPVAAWDLAGMRRVRRASPIPIMADESLFGARDALRLIAAEACDYFNIKLSKSGGLHEGLRIAAVAHAAGVPCMVGCMSETRLALTAAAHLASARPVIQFQDLDSADMHASDPVVGGITYREGGRIDLPDGPGLGAEIDPAFLAQLETFTVS